MSFKYIPFVIHGNPSNPKFTMICQVQVSRFHWTIGSKEGRKGFGETLDTVLYLSNLGKDKCMHTMYAIRIWAILQPPFFLLNVVRIFQLPLACFFDPGEPVIAK